PPASSPPPLHDALPISIVAPLLVERTERGDEMFVVMLARHSQHALDLESERLIDDAGAQPSPRPQALRPAPADERAHEPGPEQLDRKSTRLNSSHEWIS